MVVRTWNLFHGNAVPPERRAFLRQMVELVTADAPGVVCLQEVPVWALRHLESWSGMQAFAAVARKPRAGNARLGGWLTAPHHGRLRSAFSGEAGAILVAQHFSVDEHRPIVVSASGLRRVAQSVLLDGRIVVANFHSAGDDQFRRVADSIEREGGEAAILAGDANLRPGDGETYGLLRGRGFSEPLPASIDQILVRGRLSTPPVAWPAARRRTGRRLLSDHAPVELTVG